MTEFIRNNNPDNIFEGTADAPIEVVLKFKEDFENTYERNVDNALKFNQVKNILTSEPIGSFFQKQKSDETNNRSRHKIIIPIGNEKAVEASVVLWVNKIDTFTELYSYSVGKFKEISFFSDPNKNTLKSCCVFKITTHNKQDGTNSNSFKELYKKIESLEVPTIDINKEKDKQIWHNYVVALKKLVKQKEQVWKIQKISQPYAEKNDANSERANYIDIYINEKDLIEQFEKDFEGSFNVDELEDYGVSEDKAFIEFSNYRELSQDEIEKLNELAGEYFYDMSKNSPIHYLSGEFRFKFSEISSKDEVFNQIKNILSTDYQIEVSIDSNGCTNITETDFPHIQKVVNDNFEFLLRINRDNEIKLKVDLNENEISQNDLSAIKEHLQKNGIDNRAKFQYNKENKEILIEVGANVNKDVLSNYGFLFKSRINRYGSNSIKYKLKEIEGLTISNNEYHIENVPNKERSNEILSRIRDTNEDLSIRQLPTRYYFTLNRKQDINKLRSFKTATDVHGKTVFEIASSTLRINAENLIEYELNLKRIKDLYPTATIQDKPYIPSFYIQFKTDIEAQRQSIIGKIQNEIRKEINSKVEYDILKNNTRVLFSFGFTTEDEREKFKEIIANACDKYSGVLNYSFENNLGRTLYEFFKNETLELEKEKEVIGNVRQATFVYLTPEERDQLNQAIETYGEDERFRAGIQIGKLIRKEREKLKFRITDEFDELINAKETERIDIAEIKKGFIKPIFPGELTNIGRMIKAMKKVSEPGNKVGYPVNKNLSNFLFDPNAARQSSADIEVEKQKILSNLNEPLLKDQKKQLEAVAKSLIAKDIALIQGPPGTGKTTVIAEIIWQALLREPEAKILITSQTNLAVDNALDRIKGKKLVRPIRIGNTEKFEDEGKIYSNERMKKWVQAKSNTDEEELNSDNAICDWIKNIKTKCCNDDIYSKAILKWRDGLDAKDVTIKNTFSNAYYKYVNVFAATCSECGSRNFSETFQTTFQKNSEKQTEPEFDIVIMDEASKATPPELVLPLTLGKKVIIIGDHKQLPPMMDEREFSEALEAVGAKKLVEDWTKEDYKISQFEKLFLNAPKNFVASLDTQFRMHEQIMDCISQFYKDQEELDNGLICGIKGEMNIPDFKVKASRWHGLKSEPFIEQNHHAIWVNVETPERKIGTSYENEGETQAIQTVLRTLSKAEGFKEYFDYFKKDEDKEIGIITYYMPQMQKIRNSMYPHFSKKEWRDFEQHKFENEFQIPFRINTVDRFQGMERNIIIISTVRSNKQIKEEKGRTITIDNTKYPFALGFARELQRINVGFSRAKRLLIVIGNEKHFSNKTEYAEAIQKMHRVDIVQLQNLAAK